jgi:hypothetical protein
MNQTEMKRVEVTPNIIHETQSKLVEARVPSPRNPRVKDENQPAEFRCLVCGEKWNVIYQTDQERSCPSCRSNSVRWIKIR